MSDFGASSTNDAEHGRFAWQRYGRHHRRDRPGTPLAQALNKPTWQPNSKDDFPPLPIPRKFASRGQAQAEAWPRAQPDVDDLVALTFSTTIDDGSFTEQDQERQHSLWHSGSPKKDVVFANRFAVSSLDDASDIAAISAAEIPHTPAQSNIVYSPRDNQVNSTGSSNRKQQDARTISPPVAIDRFPVTYRIGSKNLLRPCLKTPFARCQTKSSPKSQKAVGTPSTSAARHISQLFCMGGNKGARGSVAYMPGQRSRQPTIFVYSSLPPQHFQRLSSLKAGLREGFVVLDEESHVDLVTFWPEDHATLFANLKEQGFDCATAQLKEEPNARLVLCGMNRFTDEAIISEMLHRQGVRFLSVDRLTAKRSDGSRGRSNKWLVTLEGTSQVAQVCNLTRLNSSAVSWEPFRYDAKFTARGDTGVVAPPMKTTVL